MSILGNKKADHRRNPLPIFRPLIRPDELSTRWVEKFKAEIVDVGKEDFLPPGVFFFVSLKRPDNEGEIPLLIEENAAQDNSAENGIWIDSIIEDGDEACFFFIWEVLRINRMQAIALHREEEILQAGLQIPAFEEGVAGRVDLGFEHGAACHRSEKKR